MEISVINCEIFTHLPKRTKTFGGICVSLQKNGERAVGVLQTSGAATADFYIPTVKKRTVLDEEEARRKKEEDDEFRRNETRRMLDEAKRNTESAVEAARALQKAMTIALRIMSGDNVPNADQKWLAEYDIELYTNAVARRVYKPDPEDHESLIEDEDEVKPTITVPGPVASELPSNTETTVAE